MTYDPETGNFVCRGTNEAGRGREGKVCGCTDRGKYRKIMIDRKGYSQHRLVWFWFHNTFPKAIDHIDGNPQNNRIENLREATAQQNAHNRRVSKRCKSGYKGVIKDNRGYDRWIAWMRIGGKQKYLGYYKTPEEAAAAYDRAAKEIHGEFMRPNFDEFESL